MTDMTMIERVARAIAKSAHGDDEGWAAWVDEARAAIEALRVPTRRMIEAGCNPPHDMVYRDSRADEERARSAAVFGAMIDAALSEHPNKD